MTGFIGRLFGWLPTSVIDAAKLPRRSGPHARPVPPLLPGTQSVSPHHPRFSAVVSPASSPTSSNECVYRSAHKANLTLALLAQQNARLQDMLTAVTATIPPPPQHGVVHSDTFKLKCFMRAQQIIYGGGHDES